MVKKAYAAIFNPLVPETCEPGATSQGANILALFLAKLMTIILIIGGIALLFMILWAALEWITAGGDAEKVKAAQKRLMTGIIGFTLIAVATIILDFVGGFLGIEFLRTLDIPWPTLQ